MEFTSSPLWDITALLAILLPFCSKGLIVQMEELQPFLRTASKAVTLFSSLNVVQPQLVPDSRDFSYFQAEFPTMIPPVSGCPGPSCLSLSLFLSPSMFLFYTLPLAGTCAIAKAAIKITAILLQPLLSRCVSPCLLMSIRILFLSFFLFSSPSPKDLSLSLLFSRYVCVCVQVGMRIGVQVHEEAGSIGLP